MTHRIVRVALALLIAEGAAASAAPNFTDVYFFGASNLDAGNWLNHPFWSVQPGAPIASSGYYRGRWQSGPVWADYFAEALGFLATASSNGGNNYAFGAAGTSPHPGETPGAPGTPGHALYFSTQIDQVLAAKGGVLDPGALYVVDIGHNDPAVFGRTPAEAPTAAGVVLTQIQRLQTAGARHFVIRTLPPGLGPYAAPFNEALLAGRQALVDAGATVYTVLAASFVAYALQAPFLASIGITDFGNCRADTACQAGASAAALADTIYDHAFLFFDNVGPHFNHAVQEEIARHALNVVNTIFADGFESGDVSVWTP